MSELTVAGHRIAQWIVALGLASIVYVAALTLKKIGTKRLQLWAEKTRVHVDDLFVKVLDQTHPVLMLLTSLSLGALTLTISASWTNALMTFLTIILIVQGGLWISCLVFEYLSLRMTEHIESDPGRASVYGVAKFILRLLIWTIVVLLVLDNLNIDITALIAGLGIGGVAVALAVQNVLGDLLGSLSIVLDKPFEVGDFIIVDEFVGHVENIGVKTTRIRSLSGEQLILSNSDLLSSRIRNYKRLYERRVLFSLGVLCETPYDKLVHISHYIQAIIEAQRGVRFDRAHFRSFGNFALEYEVVYYVLDPDYNRFMDIQQQINLAIVKKFEAESIELAYPTQTLFVKQINRQATPDD